jgi:phosphoserine phosphatase
MAGKSRFRHGTIAVIYDFDGTLTPQPMQEYTVFPRLGITAKEFWADVQREARRTRGDAMLAYMRLLLRRIEDKHRKLSRRDLRALGRRIRYFPGVDGWFPRVNAYVRERSAGLVKVKNYIVSAGQKEILDGIAIRRHFARIFASEYFFDERGVATFPNIVINDTLKTQYIFRINKGREDIRRSINEHMPEDARPIPIRNMIYVGDGMTDVPSMTVTKKNGGHAIAVYREGDRGSRSTCRQLLKANRIDFYAPADFRRGRDLEGGVRLVLDMMIARIRYERDLHARGLLA